jgi:hypothetical protein
MTAFELLTLFELGQWLSCDDLELTAINTNSRDRSRLFVRKKLWSAVQALAGARAFSRALRRLL